MKPTLIKKPYLVILQAGEIVIGVSLRKGPTLDESHCANGSATRSVITGY